MQTVICPGHTCQRQVPRVVVARSHRQHSEAVPRSGHLAGTLISVRAPPPAPPRPALFTGPGCRQGRVLAAQHPWIPLPDLSRTGTPPNFAESQIKLVISDRGGG